MGFVVPRARLQRLVAAVLVLAALFLATVASAHEVGLSRSDLRAEETRLSLEAAFARKDLLALEPALDADKDGALAPAEVASPTAETASRLAALFQLAADGAPCAGKLSSVKLDADDGAVVHLGFEACDGQVSFDVSRVLAALPSGHRHAAFVYPAAGDPEEHVLRGDASSYVTAAFAPVAPVAPPAPPSAIETAWEYFVLGIEHILFGIDHVVFLMGLILVGGRFRQLAIMITAFTASHSITLALAVLGVIAPSPSIVEPVIALSVAYVGVENFLVKDASKRWRVAGLFGLIHGFGFAGALGEVGLPKQNLVPALATFNIGVEVGQLALLALALPLVLALRKREWFVPRGVQALSAAVALAGIVWFFERVLPGS
jgi:hydrogenase/urease accessory protein HupE